MNTVRVLIQGYAQKLPDGRWHATSTTVLVHSQGKNVIIDPGMFPEELKAALAVEKMAPGNIDVITSSHSHQDHARNAKLFDKAKIYAPFQENKKIPDDLVIPNTKIKVIFTPGHVDNHVSFLVETAEGQCAIAGDVFWWQEDEEQKTDTESLISHTDPVGKDQAVLQASRKKLLSMADYVIPGHGKIFKIPR